MFDNSSVNYHDYLEAYKGNILGYRANKRSDKHGYA